MFSHRVNTDTELRLINRPHAVELFALMNANREHLQRWHPWVANVRTLGDLERVITGWQQQYVLSQVHYAGIWHREKLCGVINHLSIDWTNRSTILSYWLAAAH